MHRSGGDLSKWPELDVVLFPRNLRRLPVWALLCVALPAVSSTACQKTYYRALERVGIEKRELLSRRVERAKESQQEAQEEFKSALDVFREVVRFEGGKLEEQYDRMRDAHDQAKRGADEVGERIDAVESVAEALLEEWEAELDEYDDASLRRKSEAKLASTQRRYDKLVKTMRRAESKLEPALSKLHDHVLFLKHNLNAAAVSSLKDEVPKLEQDVERLVEEVNRSVAEADRFLAEID